METKYEGCSREVDALLRFFEGRKLISKKDIIEFSQTYSSVRESIISLSSSAEILGLTHNMDSEHCWCSPTVEEHDNGNIIIHNQ